ncbi:MAG: dicarboxylate/amino acid:cation symporter [Holosporales bacterium]|jgi:Na+/H+-dicarboxylate symporter|nr:dicarboxylate/amino acid:cation symporter [Holosporales bacterium]
MSIGRFFKYISSNILLGVLCALILGYGLAFCMPPYLLSFFYSISCSIKDILMFSLPFIIFSYLVAAIIFYENNAYNILVGVLVGVIVSIFIATFYSYGIGRAVLSGIITHPTINDLPGDVVAQLWTLPLPCMSNDRVMLFAVAFAIWLNLLSSSFISRLRNSHYRKMDAAVVGNIFKAVLSFGIFATNSQLNSVKRVITSCKNVSERMLLKLFCPVIPLYVLGFVIKLSKEATSGFMIKDFGPIFMFNVVCIVFFVAIAYLIAAKFNPITAWVYFKNMLPAVITGFSTMSSVATLPITIQSEEKNIHDDHDFARLIIPTTVNVHAIGDVINICLSGLALLLLTSHGLPSFSAYAMFATYTCIAQFSCVSVPGGGIVIMAGVLQQHLGLSAESVMLLTSMYFLTEPFLTAINVAYNGAFTIILKNMLNVKRI